MIMFVLTVVSFLVAAALFLVGEEDEDVFEDGCEIHEESERVPNIVPISHPELLHDHLSVVEDECAHHN